MRRVLLALALGAVGAVGFASAPAIAGHDPVTICHKLDGPNITITVDDSAVQAHLDHGDALGPCDGGTTTTTTTDPPTTTTTSSSGPRCPPGLSPVGGKDGDESEPYHNQECCYDVNANGVCDTTEQALTVIRMARYWWGLLR